MKEADDTIMDRKFHVAAEPEREQLADDANERLTFWMFLTFVDRLNEPQENYFIVTLIGRGANPSQPYPLAENWLNLIHRNSRDFEHIK